MRLWPALLVAPLLALASIGFGYALVPAACNTQATWILHATILGCLAVCVTTTVLAYAETKGRKDPFLALVATWNGAFFSLVIASQWATQLFLSPCAT